MSLESWSRRLNRLEKLTPRFFKERLDQCDRASNGYIPDCEIERVFSYYIFKELCILFGMR
jgi:hypothetical protein